MENIILSPIPLDDLISRIIIELKKLSTSDTYDTTEYLTRREVSKLFHMSLVTLNKHTKAKRIKSYKIGARVLYKRSEILELDTG